MKAALSALAVEVGQGKSVGSSGSVSAAITAFIEHRKAEGALAPSTVVVYESSLDRINGTDLATKALSKVQPYDVEQAINRLRAEGAGPYVLSQCHRLIRAAMNQAVAWGWITRNPVLRGTGPRLPQKRVEAPTADQVLRVVEELAINSPDTSLIVMLGAITGLRRGALCGLRWSDIDGDRIVIRRSLVLAGKEIVERPPKMRAEGEFEELDLGDAEQVILRKIRALQMERAAQAGSTLPEDGWIYSSDGVGGSPRRPDYLTKTLSSAGKAVGVKISPHDLRHFAATVMLSQGIDVGTVARRLHHRDPALTLRVYDHPDAERARAAGETVSKALGV